MARKKKHDDHINHEAWAIPYGDLITLLLAFFVVMYAVSSVNEGKYRVMADALSSAFGSTRGSAGVCEVEGRLRDPSPACSEFRPRGGQAESAPAARSVPVP